MKEEKYELLKNKIKYLGQIIDKNQLQHEPML